VSTEIVCVSVVKIQRRKHLTDALTRATIAALKH